MQTGTPYRLGIMLAALLLVAQVGQVASAAEIVRHDATQAPVAFAVEVPPGRTTVYLSGKLPALVAIDARGSSRLPYGDTLTQTISVLEQIQAQLEALGMGMQDVVKLQAFLVGVEENNGRMDLEGFVAGYARFFGSSVGQPRLPARSTLQVAGLAHAGQWVEIEAIAVRPREAMIER